MSIAGRVRRYLRPYLPLAWASLGLVLAGGIIDMAAPWPLQVLIDNVLGGRPLAPLVARLAGPIAGDRTWLLVAAVAAGLVLTALSGIIGVAVNYTSTRLNQRLVLDFRSDLFQHVQRLSLAYHDARRSGDFMDRINTQSRAIGNISTMMLPLVQSALTLAGMFAIALRLDARLALLSLVVVPFLYYSVGYYTTHVQAHLNEVQDLEGQSLSIVHEAMSMIRVIVAFGRERHEYERFRRQGEAAVDARVLVTVRQTWFAMAVATSTAIGTAIVLGFGAERVLQGRLTVGQLLVVMAYIASVYKPLQTISTAIGTFQEYLVNLRRAFDLLETEPEVQDRPGARVLVRPAGRVTFDDVSFGYPGRPAVLRHVSFDLPGGQSLAVVGSTGAGKSTLVSLIPRFFDPSSGSVRLDGEDIRDVTVASLRAQISFVLQDPLLFSGTIADNIRYGRLDAAEEEIVLAARAANAHDFISRLPQGYQTRLGERGTLVSGGERQRIAVARAFLKNAPILILDEPTSSIDSRTEAVILEALDRLASGRTTITIAHRLSTIRRANLIVVLHQGAVVERGSHDELVAMNGVYRKMHDAQAGSVEYAGRPGAVHP